MARTPPNQQPQQGAQGTADRDEIARFTAMADAWWDSTGKFRPLHMINPARIGFIRDHLSAHLGRDPLGESPF
ncbi:MAG: bifunctional 3-demethylubiquinol 3-O-methyltransferase/2-polyprenyl-6-hydroxyphenol methylase, partial [Rhodospirillales bacterium]|nr:bifunctional 3-demethylubiquinol 3-O-methyltransferase/2-polyprenyl-6-hydroxyphenol methylase [Rhodospirillales bacterium]